jgi:hypothetical protein
MQSDIITIDIPSHHNIFEHHLVACESASLISEDVFDLTQFLVDRHCMTLHRTVVLETVHLFVIVHGVALEHLDELEGNYEGDWDKGGVEDEV